MKNAIKPATGNTRTRRNPEKCAAFIEEAAQESPARFVYVEEPEAKKLAAEGWHVRFRADLR